MGPGLIWIVAGIIMMLLEIIVPGGVIVFLGLAALLVGLSVYFGWVSSVVIAIITWFIISLFLMLVLRTFFIKHFEGDSSVQSVDEDDQSTGSIVEVIEDIFPHKDGRVKFREATWVARSDEIIEAGRKAVIIGRDGLSWIVKSI